MKPATEFIYRIYYLFIFNYSRTEFTADWLIVIYINFQIHFAIVRIANLTNKPIAL